MSALSLAIPDFAHRAVLITGSSTGIDKAVACAFAAQGAKVMLEVG